MSFAGPYDPMIQLAMRNAAAKGVILIAASGNMGAKSPPLYPAADPHVIAVTATDESDTLFTQAVRGPHLAVAAPGVDVMVPAPDDTYQLTTGTSVAAAHVSGVAALLLERHPSVDARTVLEVLTSTARNLNPKGRDDQYGWGLIDPAAALQELDSRIADGKLIATAKPAAPKAATKSATAPKPAAPKTASPKPNVPNSAPRPASDAAARPISRSVDRRDQRICGSARAMPAVRRSRAGVPRSGRLPQRRAVSSRSRNAGLASHSHAAAFWSQRRTHIDAASSSSVARTARSASDGACGGSSGLGDQASTES